MLIRDEAVSDPPAIHDVHMLAFRGSAEAKLVDQLRQSGDVVISLVAADGDRILGHVLLSLLRAPMRALALAPVGVHPDFQRQGIGSALIRKGLERARRDGWEAVFVLGDTSYYSRFGFSVEAAEGYVSPYSGEHFMMLPLGPGDIPTAGQLVYPAPFGALDWVRLRLAVLARAPGTAHDLDRRPLDSTREIDQCCPDAS
jgi:putative acetyltransferase